MGHSFNIVKMAILEPYPFVHQQFEGYKYRKSSNKKAQNERLDSFQATYFEGSLMT